MFTKPATGINNTAGTAGIGKGARFGRRRTRVRGLAEHFSEFPVAALAEEILDPGDGRIRGLISVAGNLAVSTPDARTLDRALGELEFMVSVDIYLNETTRHADVILPGESNLTRSHYDVAFMLLSCRNVANYSPPAVAPEPRHVHEWEVLLRLAGVVTGQGPQADIAGIDGFVARQLLERGVNNRLSPAHGVDVNKAWATVADGRGPERLLDILLRTGPYGEAFGRNPDGLSLQVLLDHPHGVDLGPLESRIPEVLRTPTGKIELAPVDVEMDVERLRASLDRQRNGELVLIGRRQLRSNNSWMHNLPALVGGSNTCTVQIHPDDAARLGLEDGKQARITSAAGSVDIEVEVTDIIRPGVVSVPHGWGDGNGDVRMRVAASQPGVNSNVLSPAEVDPLSGNAILNGIAVSVSAI
jgi:anaerobic selenocysteine-containing dehydrogenase